MTMGLPIKTVVDQVISTAVRETLAVESTYRVLSVPPVAMLEPS